MENYIRVGGIEGANSIDASKWKLVSHNIATDEFTFALRAKEVKAVQAPALDTGHLQEIMDNLQDLERDIQMIMEMIQHHFPNIKPREL